MKKCIVVHRKDQNNVGDIASNPLQYFMKENEYETVDITNIGTMHFDESVPVIAGGGGLLANAFMDEALRDLTICYDEVQLLETAKSFWQVSSSTNKHVRDEFFTKLNELVKEYANKLSSKKSPRIIWGAGHNGEYQKKIKGQLEYPKWLKLFDSIGVRDYGQEYPWVPCASCMHPALRKNYVIRNRVIWFEHKKQLIKSTEFGSQSVPRFINSGNNIQQTIEVLGSADIIVTNSYHGAYWGTLLGRKVIVVEPWSSKFNALKHKPYFLGKGESWEEVVNDIPTYNTALEECIYSTEQYWNKVKGML